MKIEFIKIDQKLSKAEKLLTMLRHGERGSMEYFAKKLNTSKHGVRSFVCSLRKQGHNIFNRAVVGSRRKTEYFLVKKGMKEQVVINKVHHTMDVPKGYHILKVT
jgi:biotin operon repressor